jgi:hypothetical protein
LQWQPLRYNPMMLPSLQTPLAQLLDPVAKCLTPAVARQLVELRPEPTTQARIDELAAKANEGTLSPAERIEYEKYVEAIDVVSILQAKARKMLATADA